MCKHFDLGFLKVTGGKVEVKLNLMTIHALEKQAARVIDGAASHHRTAKVNQTQRKILSAISKLDDLDKSVKQNLENPQRFHASRLGRKIAGLEGDLDKMLDKMSDTMGRVVKAEKRVPKLVKNIEALGKNTPTVQFAEKAIPICVNLAFSIGSFSDGIAASQQALNVTANVLAIAADAAGELEDIAN